MSKQKRNTDAAAKLDKYRRLDQDPLEQDGGDMLAEGTTEGTDIAMDAITAWQEAITPCQATLMTRIEEVKVDRYLVRKDFQKLRERDTDTKTSLSNVEDSLPHYKTPRQHATASESTIVEAR